MNVNKIKTQPIKTVLVITIGMLVIYLITNRLWALYVSLIIGTLGLISTYLALKIDYLWMKLTWLLSLLVPNIILSFFFYVFLCPIAFLSKTFGEKNQLSLKNTSPTLFKNCNKQFNKESFEKQW